MTEFSIYIKTYRIEHGMTQAEFANRLGKTQADLSRYENGQVLPFSSKTIKRMSEVTGTPIADLIKIIERSKEEGENHNE